MHDVDTMRDARGAHPIAQLVEVWTADVERGDAPGRHVREIDGLRAGSASDVEKARASRQSGGHPRAPRGRSIAGSLAREIAMYFGEDRRAGPHEGGILPSVRWHRRCLETLIRHNRRI